jgi:hypothetical protein
MQLRWAEPPEHSETEAKTVPVLVPVRAVSCTCSLDSDFEPESDSAGIINAASNKHRISILLRVQLTHE